MEVFARYGSKEHKEKWLKPLLNGEIRSCFAMTEPGRRLVRRAQRRMPHRERRQRLRHQRPQVVVVGHGRSALQGHHPDGQERSQRAGLPPAVDDRRAARHAGIKIVKMLHVFGYDDAPHGHAEVVYDNVRVPKSNILLGEGRGFEIAQGRLGPGRIHHCMRAIGVAERALEMAIKRAKSRVAFGQRISEMGVTKAHVADMRMEIDMARLLVLKAAWAMDKFGNKEARQQIAMIKVAVPNISSKVVDRCLQLHGAGGVSQVFKLASMYAHQRTLRLADGPDEVHRDQVGRLEIAKYN
jgi:acyl-CoA dehydrogenase